MSMPILKFSLFFSFLLFFPFQLIAAESKLPDPLFVIGDKDQPETNFFKINALVTVSDSRILVVDSGNHRVQILSGSGEFLDSLGSFGRGPGELDEPSGALIIEGMTWVADSKNGRTQLFDQQNRYVKTLKSRHIPMPQNIVSFAGKVIIAGQSVHPTLAKLCVYQPDGSGEQVVSLDYFIESGQNPMSMPWEHAFLVPKKSSLWLGYFFDNKLVSIDSQFATSNYINMEDHFPRFGKRAGMPEGFSATAFAAGPGSTLFIAAPCDNKQRTCRTLLLYDTQKRKMVARYQTSHHIWNLAFDLKLQRLYLSNQDYQVFAYDLAEQVANFIR